MRGRTLSQAFVILDEAQNTTTEQMFMLLTRLGQDSKCVVTGDRTGRSSRSKRAVSVRRWKRWEGRNYRVSLFDETDVVRLGWFERLFHREHHDYRKKDSRVRLHYYLCELPTAPPLVGKGMAWQDAPFGRR
jgi:phosphate starvation-inducible PhoH-like protein